MEPNDATREPGPDPGPVSAWAERVRRGPRSTRVALGVGSIIASAGIALAWLPAPWVWIGFAWFAVLFLASWLTPRSGAIWFNLGIACLVLGMFEANAQRKPSFRFDRDPAGEYLLPDDDLGYAPSAVGPTRTARHFGDQLAYEVVYTLDDDHLRIAPPASRDSPCILFFGGSYTYGEGVGDEETLPWQVGIRTRGPVFNFGFHGYGPHQMLAAIESGRVERAVSCTPTHAIYQAIIDHVNRVAGIAFWDRHGPRFELDAGGTVIRRGQFDDEESPVARFVLDQFGKSRIVDQVSQRRREVGPDDIALFVAVVARARDELVARHPGIEFHAIMWDRSGSPDPEFWRGLDRRGIPVHLMSRILPGQRDYDLRFIVSPLDAHPNGTVHTAIARYVVRRIVASRLSSPPRPGEVP